MGVFKTAMRIFLAHPIYIVIYLAFFTSLGSIVASYSGQSGMSTLEPAKPVISIIDRDNSTISREFTTFMETRTELVNLPDEKLALQDAVAQNQASVLIFVPEGFQEDFLSAAENNRAMPQLEIVRSYDASADAPLTSASIQGYLNALKAQVASGAYDSLEDQLAATNKVMDEQTPVSLVDMHKPVSLPTPLAVYLHFAGYMLPLSVIVLVGIVLIAFNRIQIENRTQAGATSVLARNLQLALACFVIVLLIIAAIFGFGLFQFGGDLSLLKPEAMLLVFLDLLAISTFALSIAFVLAQLKVGDEGLNAAGNIIALFFAFIGGIMVPLNFLDSTMQTVAKFSPSYYYLNAITELSYSQVTDANVVSNTLTNIGMVFLFGIAIFAVALALGKIQSRGKVSV